MLRSIRKKLFDLKQSPLHEGVNGSFVFIHVNKTGGLSIATALGVTSKSHYRRHYTAKEAIKRIGEQKWRKAYKFSVVRNPYARVFSQFNHRIKTNQNKMNEQSISFKDWIINTFKNRNVLYYDKPRMFLPQIEWLRDKNNEILFDQIIRFENINQGFGEVAKAIGIDAILPHLNATDSGDYQIHYDEESKRIISNWFREDLDYFKYQF